MSEKYRPAKICPYWEPDSDQPCTMRVGGLFVPLEEHILTFCQTEQAVQCRHYIRGSNLLKKDPWALDLLRERGRRRHHRFTGRYSLSVAAEDRPHDRKASTIDLSVGGMRIETAAEVPEKGTVSFTFGDDFWLPGLTGLAEVRWRRRTESGNRYEYGLGFVDPQIGETIGESLGP